MVYGVEGSLKVKKKESGELAKADGLDKVVMEGDEDNFSGM